MDSRLKDCTENASVTKDSGVSSVVGSALVVLLMSAVGMGIAWVVLEIADVKESGEEHLTAVGVPLVT